MALQKPFRLFWRENYSQKPPQVKLAIKKALKDSSDKINLYPGSLYDDVIELIARTRHVSNDQIILGHGIEGLIHLTSQTFLTPESTGGMFSPSFFVFANNLKRYRSVTYQVALDKKVDVDDLLQKIKDVDVFYLASPNTDTGSYLLSKEEIEHILQTYNGILGVDECYFGMGRQTVIDLIDSYKNLIVYNGVTKVMGMASIRLGYAVANKDIINKLKYNQNDIELDPINTFSLNIFKEVFPHFQELADNTNKFEQEFIEFMGSKFPETTFRKTLVTFHFMDLKPFNKQPYEVINTMTEAGYVMSGKHLTDNSTLNFPQFLEITPPPKEIWEYFAKTLRKCLVN